MRRNLRYIRKEYPPTPVFKYEPIPPEQRPRKPLSKLKSSLLRILVKANQR